MTPFHYPQDCQIAAVSLAGKSAPLVSIIVPVYNAPLIEFKRCMASLMNQTYQNIEVVIVDDGSDQSCADCISDIVDQDARFRSVKGGHQGVSHARNVGIAEAKGEWVAFSDADDENDPMFIEQALSVALSLDCDLVCGTVKSLYVGDEKTPSSGEFDGYVTELQHQDEEVKALAWQMLGHVRYTSLDGPDFHGRGPWGKLYRASLLQSVQFDSNVPIGEDTLFSYYAISRAQRVALVEALWYWYYQYESSAVHGASMTPWAKSIDGVLAARGEGEDITPFVSRCAFTAMLAVKNIAAAAGVWGGRSEAVALLKYARERKVFQPPVFKGYGISVWVTIFLNLCKCGLCSIAYFYWVIKEKAKGRMQKKLFVPQVDDVKESENR